MPKLGAYCWMKNTTKYARPKSIEAVTATWPMRLNQPVVHDQAAEFFFASLADQ